MKLKLIAVAAVVAILTSCASPYQVRELTDQYSDPAKPSLYSMLNNSMYVGGMLSVGSTLDGFVMRDRKTSKVVRTGFYLTIESGEINGKWVGIRPGDALVFIADGERIQTEAISGDVDHRIRTIGYNVETDYIDKAQYFVTPAQFRKIAFSKELKFQASGKNRTEDFPRGNLKFVQSFRLNLQKFFTEQVSPYL